LSGWQTPEQQSLSAVHAKLDCRQHTSGAQIEPPGRSQSLLSAHGLPSGVTAQPFGVHVPEQHSPSPVHGA
jgi:hypothetical protein